MRKRSLLAVASVLAMLFAVLPLTAAGAVTADIFFSEYIEGSSNNKAVEIFNGTGGSVDLAPYTVERYNNGAATPSSTTDLTGTIDVDDVYVVANSGANAAILAEADLQSSLTFYNGDDALVLKKSGVIIDSIGRVGEDPGSEWGTGDASTGENTIRRMSSVCSGDTDPTDPYDPATEWDGYPQNDSAGLGSHTGCGVTTTTTTTSSTTTTTAPPSAVADVIINEVDADTATDTDEFIELYAVSGGAESLDGLSIVMFNGSDDASYTPTLDLDGFSTNASGYFVICTDTANVANCDVGLGGGAHRIQNGADAVALLADDAVNYPNDTAIPGSSVIVDALVYDTSDGDDAALLALLNAGQPQVNERGGGDGDGHSNQRCANGTGGNRNTGTYTQFVPTPGAENCVLPPVPAVPVFIHEIQGSSGAHNLDGVKVEVEAVVVGDFQGFPGLGGFFVQEEDSDADSDALTSEGIFVFEGSSFTNVNMGDVVKVVGVVDDQFGLTQIESVESVTVTGTGAVVTPATASLPLASANELEAIEGMSVHWSQKLYATETYTLGQYGQVMLSSSARLDIPTNVLAPGAAADALQAANSLNRIELDDGISWSNFFPTPFLGIGNTLRGGDSVTGLTGVMSYSFSTWEVHATGPVPFVRENVRPATAPSVGGDLTVASFNVLNYFSTIDDSGSICGPAGNQGCRGADDAGEFTRQRTKIINAVVKLDADVVGLMEIENHATDAAIDDLVAGVNAIAGAGTYAKVGSGPIGGDAIRVAIIYKPASVTPSGASAILDESVDPTFLDSKNRPVMAQTFMDNSNGGSFTVAVNHLKSKGSPCGDVGDPDAGDGQGNCNGVRTAAAQALVNWLAGDPTGSGDADMLIIGDLNSYAKEDPIAAIKGAGYTDLIQAFQGVGLAENAYTYVFRGQWGYLDHALSSSSMSPQVTGTAPWHINADEPPALDYNNWNDPAVQTGDEFRSSDHDPVVIGLSLATNAVEDIEYAKSLITPTGDEHTDKHLGKANDALDKALNPAYWDGPDMVNSKKVFDELKKAVKEIEKAYDHGILSEGDAENAIAPLVKAARDLAVKALDDAAVDPVDPKHLDHGWDKVAKGDHRAADYDWDKAVGEYKKAWDEAGKALKEKKGKKTPKV